LGEGWGEGKPMPHSLRISEFGIAVVAQILPQSSISLKFHVGKLDKRLRFT
jgi:hypothetical protein